MGNSVSAHIYETEVFRTYPGILYRLRWTPLSIGGKKLVSLRMIKFGILRGKVTVHV